MAGPSATSACVVDGASTLGTAVAALSRAFAAAGLDTPALDARRLVLFALGLEPPVLLREPERPLSELDRRRLDEVVRRRLAREPVSRIEGRRAFHDLDLEIGPATLDPRPETETLVDAAIELMAKHTAPRILDPGTGSGAILLALLDRLPAATGIGVDISQDALDIAGRNAVRLGLASRASFHRSNWLASVEGTFDLVVSNPPYIPRGDLEALEPEVAGFDPRAALDGGSDGLAAYRALAADLIRVLRCGAWVVVEVGAGQSEDVARILRAAVHGTAHMESRVWHDLGGIARCVAVRSRA